MSSYPLPALSIHPPQQTDPTEGIQRILMMRNLINQGQLQQQSIQGAQLENTLRANQVKAQQTLQQLSPQFVQRDSTGKPTGYDYEGLKSAAMNAGLPLPYLDQITTSQKNWADAVLASTNADKAKLDNQQKLLDQGFQHLEGVRGIADPAKRQSAWESALQWANQSGLDVSKFPQQAPTDDELTAREAQTGMHAQALADVKARGDIAKTAAETEQAQAASAKTKAEMAYYQEHGGAPGVPAEQMSMADWLAKPENKGKGPSDYEEHMKKLVPAFNFSLMNATGQGQPAADVAKKFGMSPVAFDQAAEKYWTSGQLPPSGRGGPALAMNKAIQNRAAELHPEGSLAANSAEYEANKDSLKKIQTQFDSVNAFENTALKNINMALEKAKAVPDLGTRFANAPVRAISEKMLGTPEMAAFRAALTTAQTESAKVLNSANATGVLSDSARGELQQLLSGNLSYKAMQSAFQTLQQDMSNRHDSYAQQIQDIQGRLGGKAAAPAGAGAVIYARDAQGNLHKAASGTPLPAGWKPAQPPQ